MFRVLLAAALTATAPAGATLSSWVIQDATLLAPAGWEAPTLDFAAPRMLASRVPGKIRLSEAMLMLETTETGRGLIEAMQRNGTKVDVDSRSYAYYLDGTDRVSFGEEFLASAETWQTAVILAHELEHARQRHQGLAGHENREARELGAFLVQCRVWVELGGRVRGSDWKLNAMNSQDMWAWVEYPRSAMAALTIRAEMARQRSPLGQAYLSDVLAGERAWRAGRSMPTGRDSLSAARFILKQAAGLPKLDAPSDWLPEYLEEGGHLLPGMPSAFDKAAIDSLTAALP